MYRFVLLLIALLCFTVIALRQETPLAAPAPKTETVWSQAHTVLPATHIPPYSPGSTWGVRLNPAGTIFASGFRAFYFDRTDPSVGVVERAVEDIWISDTRTEFHGIEADRLGAYWVGQVDFSKETVQRVNLNMGRASARLYIDGRLIYEAARNHSLDYKFAKGRHLIEVDFVNRWHSTDFAMTISEPHPVLGRRAIAATLADLPATDYDLYYVGTYDDSSTEGAGTVVRLPPSRRPAILWLDSYDPVDWLVDARGRAARVIVASHEPGARVDGTDLIDVVSTREAIGIRSESRGRCDCIRGYFHCSDDQSIGSAARTLKGRRDIAGYSVGEDAAEMDIQPYNARSLERLHRANAEIERQERICRR